ncbi:MAG: Crp/Fnr family transcriptional regulator [Gammaproteobacteria bacterium]|nr:Crp/Fnr family transcriptional regulator [Gammaproteobacteria bacterium]
MNSIQKQVSEERFGFDRGAPRPMRDESRVGVRFEDLTSVRTLCFMPKDVIYHTGDPADKIYEVRSGLVKLVTYLASGKQRIVRLNGAHDWLGLAGFMQESHEHTAIAATSVEVLCISVSDYPLRETGAIHHYDTLLETLLGQLKKADIWIERFATGCIRTRVAHLVNYLSEVEYGEGSMKVRLLTCEEMAAILGTTTESVSTVLAEFKRTGALRPQGNPFEKQYERAPELLSY